jgi:transcriptional regulator with XRE-family HTH domain
MAMARKKGQLYLADEDARLLGKLLACWQILHDVSDEKMAAALGTGQGGLSRYKHGRRPLTVEAAWRICQLTGMEIDARGVSLDDTGELAGG